MQTKALMAFLLSHQTVRISNYFIDQLEKLNEWRVV